MKHAEPKRRSNGRKGHRNWNDSRPTADLHFNFHSAFARELIWNVFCNISIVYTCFQREWRARWLLLVIPLQLLSLVQSAISEIWSVFICGCSQMCCLTEMETAVPNPYASLTIINQVWPCPVLTLSAGCVEGDRTIPFHCNLIFTES